jgi:hypothetical protein
MWSCSREREEEIGGEMKKTVGGYVHSILTNTDGYGIRTDAPITYLGRIEISWDEPEPKHECDEMPCGLSLVNINGVWLLNIRALSINTPLHNLKFCPFCGEKLA